MMRTSIILFVILLAGAGIALGLAPSSNASTEATCDPSSCDSRACCDLTCDAENCDRVDAPDCSNDAACERQSCS